MLGDVNRKDIEGLRFTLGLLEDDELGLIDGTELGLIDGSIDRTSKVAALLIGELGGGLDDVVVRVVGLGVGSGVGLGVGTLVGSGVGFGVG